jgi:hypothetical protein
VLYLDSLKMVGYNLPADHIPRIGLFDLSLLKKMINADQDNNICCSNSQMSDNASKTVCTFKVHLSGLID